MSLYNSYDRTQFLGETNFPLDTQGGVLTPAQQKAAVLANLGLGPGGTALVGNINSNGFILSTSPTGRIGYANGAGGSVTQATSRTTAVTLNRVTGAIQLVSAAGSATPASFVVNNSAVAASDVIILNQKSGTDLYDLKVTNVAAGAFTVTSNTTGGTTTEAPIFSFAVIKGATS